MRCSFQLNGRIYGCLETYTQLAVVLDLPQDDAFNKEKVDEQMNVFTSAIIDYLEIISI